MWLHVTRHLCGFSADVHSYRKDTSYVVWITVAQDNDRHSGLEYRLDNCSVPSGEYWRAGLLLLEYRLDNCSVPSGEYWRADPLLLQYRLDNISVPSSEY